MLSKAAQKSPAFAQLAQQHKKINDTAVPPMKMTPQDAIRLLEQQQAGKANVSFRKDFGLKPDDDAAIRKAAWGGT